MYVISLLRRRSLGSSCSLPPPRTSAEAKGTFLALCSKRSAREHVDFIEKPMGARLLFNRKPIINCDRTTPKMVVNFPAFNLLLMANRLQILASCMEETPKRIVGNNCFLCSFPLILKARIIVFSESSVHIAHLIALWK